MTDNKTELPVVASPSLQPHLEGSSSQASNTAVAPSELKSNFDEPFDEKLSVVLAHAKQKQPIVPKAREAYVADFKRYAKKTAQAALEMARVVHEARETLKWEEFESFCDEIGMKALSTTVVKLCCIGFSYSRLVKCVDHLPTGWTSIYLLTQIPAEQFDQVLAANKSFREMTGSQIKVLIKQTHRYDTMKAMLPKDANKRSVFGKIVFSKDDVDDIDYWAMKKAIQEIEARLPVKVLLSQTVEKLWESRKLMRYENTKQHYKEIELKPDLWDFGREANEVTSRTPATTTVLTETEQPADPVEEAK